jgi:hypothetical protein
VYGKYLKPLAYKLLSSRYNRLWIVDAYAGAGAYDPDAEGKRAEGSPLAAANIARQYNVDATSTQPREGSRSGLSMSRQTQPASRS